MRHSTSGYWFKAFEFPENPRSIASLKAVFQRFNPYKSLASPPIKSINPHDSSYFHMVSADLPWFSMIFTTFSPHFPTILPLDPLDPPPHGAANASPKGSASSPESCRKAKRTKVTTEYLDHWIHPMMIKLIYENLKIYWSYILGKSAFLMGKISIFNGTIHYFYDWL